VPSEGTEVCLFVSGSGITEATSPIVFGEVIPFRNSTERGIAEIEKVLRPEKD
jgi:hypothetical protein